MVLMDKLIQILTQNWKIIVDYTLMAIAYFLVFLYRSKVKITRRDLTALFQEKSAEIVEGDTRLRSDMTRELGEAKAAYQQAVNEIADLREEVSNLHKALEIITRETEVESYEHVTVTED
jgi:hypothetical protein